MKCFSVQMSGFAVCRGSVGSIKALWEGRIRKNQEEIQRPKSKDQDVLNRCLIILP